MSLKNVINNYVLLSFIFLFSCSPSIDKKALYVRDRMRSITKRFGQTVTKSGYETNMTDSEKRVLDTVSMKMLKKQLDTLERKLALMPDSIAFHKEVKKDENGMITSMALVPDFTKAYIYNKNKIKYIREHNINLPYIVILEDRK